MTDFWRWGEGRYEIVFDVETDSVGLIAVIASSGGLYSTDQNVNIVLLVGAQQDYAASYLTIEVYSVLSASAPDSVALGSIDCIFNLVILGYGPVAAAP